MRLRAFLSLLLPLLAGSAAAASTLSLAWGAVAEPAGEGEVAPGLVAEHLEFLRDHGWQAVRTAGADGGPQSVVLSFDDPASALRYVVPLLDLYRMPVVVTVGPAQAADPAAEPVLRALAASPWVELVPRVEAEPGAAVRPFPCETGTAGNMAGERAGEMAGETAGGETERLERLRTTLTAQVARLRSVTGGAPAAVAWAPGTWSGPGETVAAGLGLNVQLPTFTSMPPALEPPRVARFAMPPWAGVWAPVQASVHWDPKDQPVRFVEVDTAWVCAGGAPEARLARVLGVIRKLGLNGVRILPGERSGAAGTLARRLHEAGVRWVMIDLAALPAEAAERLVRAAELDVALLPAGQERLAATVRDLRPAVRVAWSGPGGAFRFGPAAPGQPESRGTTVKLSPVAAANEEAARLAVAGSDWLGLPVELAEEGLRGPLRSLAAFALPP